MPSGVDKSCQRTNVKKDVEQTATKRNSDRIHSKKFIVL